MDAGPDEDAGPGIGRTHLSGPLLAAALAAPLLLLAGLVYLATSVSLFTGGPSAARADTLPLAKARAFDARAAYRLTAEQVRYGQRPAGSPQLARLAERLRPLLPDGRFEPLPGSTAAKPLRNIVGTLPGTKPAIVIGAHYDTLVKPKGFVGANNGAAGSAIVIEVARALRALRRPAGAPELKFVLFDGEEPDAGLPEEQADFYHAGLRGSRAYVARHPGQTRAMLLLDYVGGRRLQLPREGSSDRALWGDVRAAATRAGVAAVFPDRTGVLIQDDHTPFLRAGVPAVDFIDWSYPGHTLKDGMKRIDVRALDAVGETVVAYLRGVR
ncbi:M28 family metallopeptidase [Paraconexibacter antarcticus]|uniref:M28 family metallopeptidase n=1 Tax=Paraconexibacter antarcticus TaxID=2949664 RepID=A0ABY5DY26_9ACTN|nr:M28 family metallopeptidase [Paraconexibacter antarcticus]UTI66935.1 M28 family metallopeptidase [Paraconexibacter antarcticus]